MGGTHPGHAYRLFVESGIDQPPKSRLTDEVGGWIDKSSAIAEIDSFL